MVASTIAVPSFREGVRPPRRVLRRLILGHGLGVGSRVLLVGNPLSKLLPVFERLGIRAAALEGQGDEWLGRLRSAKAFDLVLAAGGWPRCDSLFSREAFQHSAAAAGSLRPGGWLTFLDCCDDERDFAHETRCYLRHLECFPGRVLPAEDAQNSRWSWLPVRRPRYVLVGLQVAAASSERWLQLADEASMSLGGRCCNSAMR
ncbi:MAG: hypothetical protein KY476_16585 [Planctomycetes bacterium]|nr:hypothetical protein [Planctomycetota bacterium]